MKYCLKSFIDGALQSLISSQFYSGSQFVDYNRLFFDAIETGISFSSPLLATAVILSIEPDFTKEMEHETLISYVARGVVSSTISATLIASLEKIRNHFRSSQEPFFFVVTKTAVIKLGYEIGFPMGADFAAHRYSGKNLTFFKKVCRNTVVLSTGSFVGRMFQIPAYLYLEPRMGIFSWVPEWITSIPASFIASTLILGVSNHYGLPM